MQIMMTGTFLRDIFILKTGTITADKLKSVSTGVNRCTIRILTVFK